MRVTQRNRNRRAARLFDTHSGALMAMAAILTSTRDRADRLVVDTVAGQSRRRGAWRRRRHEQQDMSGILHARWLSTHGPRGPRGEDATARGRLHDLTDLQIGLIALCLFGGYSYVRAGTTLSLTPSEAAGQLRDALLAVGA